MSEIEVRYARPYEVNPFQPLNMSHRAVYAIKDGEVVAYAGLIPFSSHWVAISEMRERIPGKTCFRIAKLFRDMANDVQGLILAEADEDIPNSASFLQRIGFRQTDSGLYRYG